MLDFIRVACLRNLISIELELHSNFNFLLGANASGKTSFLEAIYLLGTGRSFRSSYIRDLINLKEVESTIFGKLLPSPIAPLGNTLALRKSVSGESKILLNGKMQNSIASFAKLLPVQIIGPDLELFADSRSGVRRQFLDWGLFYENEIYWGMWKTARKILSQRNALLKQPTIDFKQLDYWDEQWAEISEQLSLLRLDYLNRLIQSAVFRQTNFVESAHFSIEYHRGWPQKKPLIDYLIESRDRDRAKGNTQYGIHRDDIKIAVKNRMASEMLSRGQKKLMTLQLRFAQASLLVQQRPHLKSVFLLDDLASELDLTHQKKVIKSLLDLNYQSIITSTSRNLVWEQIIQHQHGNGQKGFRMFHVEHGNIIDAEANLVI